MKLTSHHKDIQPYITQDGSEIRELMHPNSQGNKSQSLAEATVKPGQGTILHHHVKSEELYYINQGKGKMRRGDEIFNVSRGDTICVPPGIQHCIENIGKRDLKILCCCSPAYSHDDTVLA